MIKLPFMKIDAFASDNSSGNPAGFVKLESLSDLTDKQMQKIARELKGYVNEVGFAAKSGGGYKLKYYSAERQVEFCGHATIAIMYTLIKNDSLCIKSDVIIIDVGGEKLSVKNKIKQQDAVFITAPEPKYIEYVVAVKEISNALITTEEKIVNKPEVINAGLSTLLVEIDSLDTILNLYPNITELKAFCEQNDIDIIEVFCKETSGDKNFYRTRVFAPRFGYLEDPATGSGNSAFGYYLLKHNLWDGETISIEQNGEDENYNIVKLVAENIDGKKKVLFGGSAVVRIDGEYCLQ